MKIKIFELPPPKKYQLWSVLDQPTRPSILKKIWTCKDQGHIQRIRRNQDSFFLQWWNMSNGYNICVFSEVMCFLPFSTKVILYIYNDTQSLVLEYPKKKIHSLQEDLSVLWTPKINWILNYPERSYRHAAHISIHVLAQGFNWVPWHVALLILNLEVQSNPVDEAAKSILANIGVLTKIHSHTIHVWYIHLHLPCFGSTTFKGTNLLHYLDWCLERPTVFGKSK